MGGRRFIEIHVMQSWIAAFCECSSRDFDIVSSILMSLTRHLKLLTMRRYHTSLQLCGRQAVGYVLVGDSALMHIVWLRMQSLLRL